MVGSTHARAQARAFGDRHSASNSAITGGAVARRLRVGALLLSVAMVPILSGTTAVAATTTFTGATSNNWSDAGNWSTAPASGDNAVLAQTGANAPSNLDINGLNLQSLTLSTAGAGTNSLTSGYSIASSSGYALGLQSGGSIIDNAVNSAADRISTGLVLAGPATISVSAGATGLVLAGNITGTGGLTVTNASGTSALQLLGTNTYTGGTTITAGTLQIGNGGTTGSITGDVANNGALVFDRSDALTFAGAISGTGSVSQIGSGTLTLTGSNGYTGGTTVSAGTLAVLNVSSIGTGNLAISNGATVKVLGATVMTQTASLGTGGATFDNSGYQVSWSGVISGTGGLTLAGTGSHVLSAANTYTGGTTISAGTLSLSGTAGSVTGAIIDNGVLKLDRTNDASFANAISGTGSVQKYQTSTVTLTGTNTYSGGTSVFAGTLQLGDGTTAGSITGNVSLLATSATLAFNAPTDTTFAGNITGVGIVAQNSAHVLTLTGANVLSGLTIASGGTIQLGDGINGSASISGAITDNGTLNVDLPYGMTISGAISGSGALIQSGSSTLILSGANSYTGGTTISAGTLQIGAGGTTGSVAGDIVNNGKLTFNRSDSAIFTGVVSGTGELQQMGTGTLVLTGDNTYTGVTTISAGTLQLGNGGTTGSIAGDVVDNGTLAFNRSDDTTFAGAISGIGGVSKLGSNTLTLSGTNTYSGGTTISAGTLAVSSATNLGSGGITFKNGAVLQFLSNSSYALSTTLETGGGTFDTNGYTVTWSSAISGTSGNPLVKTGAGTLILTGANTFSGGTTIGAGTLQLGNGGTNGSVGGDIVDNATLAFNYGGAVTYAGAISGTGAVAVIGNGKLTLTGTNTYTGGTKVSAGTLSIASDANLGTGGTLALSGGGTVQTTATGTFAHGITVNGTGALAATSGTTATWSGLIADGAGAGALTISGGGRVALTNTANSYTGGTAVVGGSTLSIDSDSELGAASGGLTLGDSNSAGTLAVTATTTLNASRSIVLKSGGGAIAAGSGNVVTLAQAITGSGKLTVAGPGTLVLTNTSTYTGGTTVAGGTLQLGDGTTAGMVAGDIVDNSTVVFAEGADTTYGGVISGTGAMVQNDAGHTLTFTGASTYTGGTTIAAGTLQIGDGGTTGAIAGDVVDNGALIFNRSNSFTLGGAISGTGSVTQAGSGTTILTGANTYSGGTTITAGTLQIGNGGTAGSITGDVVDDGVLAFNRTDSLTYAGTISGTGSVTQAGSGTTIFTGTNTYSGGTTIAAGTLQIGNGGTSGAITGNVADNGTLAFNRSDTVVFDGVVSGTGSVTQKGTGTTVLIGTNTYTGGTTITAGTLQIGNGGTTGAITGAVADNGTLVFNRSDAITLPGAISGSGSVRQIGSGTTILIGINTYTGGTAITAGVLQIGNGGTAGSIAGDVANDGTIAFNRSDASTYGGAISGSGALRQSGSGTLVLTGTSTYSGGTTITAGILQLGNGGTTGMIAGSVIDNGTLAFNHSNDVTFAGIISGAGGVRQMGAGTLTLTGTNTYTGATEVTNGTLTVNGSIASSSGITVTSGGTLAGTGSVSKLTVGDKGMVSPGGSSVGTLNVLGNLSLASGSVYAFDANGATTDLLKVTGAAQIGGTVNVSLMGSVATAPLTLVSASGGLTGTFSNVQVMSGTLGKLNAYLSYDSSHAYLMFMPTITSLVPAAAAATNASRAAGAIDFAVIHDNAGLVFQSLSSMPTATVETTLPQMTGEVFTGFQNVAMTSAHTFLDSMLDPSIGGRSGLGGGDANAGKSSSDRMSLWTSVHGSASQYYADASAGVHGVAATQFGGEIGLNYSPYQGNGAVGLTIGIDAGHWNLAGGLGHGNAMAYEVGAYYARQFGRSYLQSGLSYTYLKGATDRSLVYSGANEYQGKFSATAIAGRLEYGYRFDFYAGSLTPYLRGDVVDLGTPDFTEKTLVGSSNFALSYTRKNHFDYTSEMGLAWAEAFQWSSGQMTDLHARVGWRHDYVDRLNNTATFAAFSGAAFTVEGASALKDGAHIVLGVEHEAHDFVLSLNAEGTASATAQSYGGKAALSYRW